MTRCPKGSAQVAREIPGTEGLYYHKHIIRMPSAMREQYRSSVALAGSFPAGRHLFLMGSRRAPDVSIPALLDDISFLEEQLSTAEKQHVIIKNANAAADQHGCVEGPFSLAHFQLQYAQRCTAIRTAEARLMETMTDNLHQLALPSTEIRAYLKKFAVRVKGLMADFEEQGNNVTRLRAQLDAVPSEVSQLESKVSEKEQTISTLVSDKAGMQQEVHRLTLELAQELQQSKSAMSSAQLLEEVEQAHSATIRDFSDKLRAAKSELINQANHVQQHQKDLANMRHRAEASEATAADLLSQVGSKESALIRSQTLLHDAQQANVQLSGEKSDLAAQAAGAVRKTAKRQEEALEEAEAQRQASDRARQEAATLRLQVQNLRLLNRTHQEEIEAAEHRALSSEEAHQTQLDGLTTLAQEAKQQLAENQEAARQELQQMSQDLAALQGQLRDANAVASSKDASLRKLQAELQHSQGESQRLTSSSADLADKNRILIQDLAVSVSSITQQAENGKALQLQVAELTSIVANLQRRHAEDVSARSAAEQTLQGALEGAEEQMQATDQARQEAEVQRQASRKASDEAAMLRVQVQELHRTSQVSLEEVDRLKTELRSTQIQVQELEVGARAAKEALVTAQQEFSSNVEAQAAQLADVTNQLQFVRQQLASDAAAAHNQQQQLSQDLAAVQAQLRVKRDTASSLAKQLRGKDAGLSNSEARLRQSQEEVQRLTSRNTALADRNWALTDEAEDGKALQEQVDELTSAVADLRLRHAEAVAGRDAAEQQLEFQLLSSLAADQVADAELSCTKKQIANLQATIQKLSAPPQGNGQMVPGPFVPAQYFWNQEPNLRLIGGGSCGNVYHAQRQVAGTADWEEVAIKVMDFEDGKLALKELDNLIRFQSLSPHLIQLLEARVLTSGPLGARPQILLVTRFAEGDDLACRMGVLRNRWARLPPGDPNLERFRQQWEAALRQVMFQAVQALQSIHALGMFHGDVKPDNFRLNMNEDGSDVKLVLIDPGSASADRTPALAGEVWCNAFYTSPEGLGRWPHHQYFTTASDIWALGCILIELLQNSPAFAEYADFNLSPHEQQTLAVQKQTEQEALQRLDPEWVKNMQKALPEDSAFLEAYDLVWHMTQADPDRRYCVEDLWVHDFIMPCRRAALKAQFEASRRRYFMRSALP